MRLPDIEALLERASQDFAMLHEEAQSAKLDKIRLKNTLENIRSALDYMAQDISELLHLRAKPKKMPARVYFPYGQRDNHFRLSVERNLPMLEQHLPAVYRSIRERQPFVSKDNWLVTLCEITNEAKHDRLHETNAHRVANVKIPGVINFTGSNLVFRDNLYNGFPMDDIHVQNGSTISHVRRGFDVTISEESRIILAGRNVDVIPFLRNALSGTKALVEDVYPKLE